MDGDFQQTYQAAERAYGGGDYETAHQLASELLKQLELEEQSDDDQVRDAVIGWRAFVTLLLGHIELHGLERPDQAADYYQRALDCQPQETLAELAHQGLERCKSAPKETFKTTVDKPTTPASAADESSVGSLPSMLQDPFLNNAPPPSTPGTSQQTAMPWLTECSAETSSPLGSENKPSPLPTAEPVPSSQPTQKPAEIEHINTETTADVTSPSDNQPLPLLIPEDSIQNAWLRVSIPPEKKGDDSIPMDQAKPSSRLKRLLRGLSRS